MTHKARRQGLVAAVSSTGLALCLIGITGCDARVLGFEKGVGNGNIAPRADCRASPGWLPVTPALDLYEPRRHPAPDCPLYQGGFQNFLLATAPDANGVPAFASYATIDDLFQKTVPLPAGALAPPGAHRGTALRAWLGNVKQAGARQILIDQDGHTLYYGIHVNQAYVDFVNTNGLNTATGIQGADPNLAFPAGVVALKSAWKDIDPSDGIAGDYSSFITTMAWVARLRQDAASSEIVEDRNNPRLIRVALVALHVAYTLPGHPEFVWTTFEHVDAGGHSDVAPSSTELPTEDDPLSFMDPNSVSAKNFLLYHGGTPKGAANQAIPASDLRLDEGAQSFSPRLPDPPPGVADGGISTSFAARTSVYRAYPGSRSNDVKPDDEVRALNDSVTALFKSNAAHLNPADRRASYRMVGGIWLDKAEAFGVNASFQNDSSSPSSIQGGEDRLSSTAMEPFTQQPGSFNNCLSCHNTQATNSNGVTCDRDPNGIRLLKPKKLSVSHVLSKFLLEECQDPQPPAFCSDTCFSP